MEAFKEGYEFFEKTHVILHGHTEYISKRCRIKIKKLNNLNDFETS